jgi:hypothetical protein
MGSKRADFKATYLVRSMENVKRKNVPTAGTPKVGDVGL